MARPSNVPSECGILPLNVFENIRLNVRSGYMQASRLGAYVSSFAHLANSMEYNTFI